MRQRSDEELRRVVTVLCNFIWTGKLRPGEHLWSIPVDLERDFDCILTDGIDELVKLRAELSSLRSQMETLIQKWRDAAVWEHDDMHNTQSAQTFDQCADELSAALGKDSQ